MQQTHQTCAASNYLRSGAAKLKGRKRAEDLAHKKAHDVETRRHKNTAIVPVDGSSSVESKSVDETEDEGTVDSNWGRG